MLNPELKLNQNLFEKSADKKATREGYGAGLMSLGESNPEVVVLTGDLKESTRCEEFGNKYPERFVECGVAEQNMAGIAAGLAMEGKTAFISSYATFSPGKNWETLRTTTIYNQANVKIAGHHSGIMTGPDGSTHQATEDIAITRAWPGIIVLNPCDAIEAKKATVVAGRTKGPVYLRFSREKSTVITTDATPFDGRARIYWISENPQVTIFGTGHMLFQALLAAKELQEEGVETLVVNIATIKPLDESGVLASVTKSEAAISVEDHQVMGGLGSALAEVFAKKMPIPMEMIGLQNTFAESGNPWDILTKYGMDKTAIKNAVKKVITRKK